MSKNVRLCIGLVVSFLVAGCNDGVGSATIKMQPSTLNKHVNQLSNSLFVVGGTYDSMSQHPTSLKTCLKVADDPQNIIILNPHSSIDFTQNQSLQSVQRALGINFSEEINAGPFEQRIEYNYGKSSQDDDYTLNINYIYQYAGVAEFRDNLVSQGERVLIPEALALVDTSPSGFRQLCGDNFVSQLDAGANILMRLTLKFHSSIEKDYFDSAFRAVGGLPYYLTFLIDL